jgi:DNA polymerase I-like protein with 3'-5' exonuclease and polymerase domains
MSQANLFQAQTSPISRSERGYDKLPEQLPPGFMSADFETTGLKVRDGARPFGLAVANKTDEWFLPWNDRTIEWCLDQLAERDLVFAEAKFDIGMALADGVSFEDMGIRPHDVQHCAALLDDRRRRFALDILAKERLGRGKAVLPPGPIHELPVAIVAPYARQDARLTYDLWADYQADIKREELNEVLDLEDSLLYCTLAMEETGVNIDVPKLLKWIDEVEQERIGRLLAIWRKTGLRINPSSGPDMAKLFGYLNLRHDNSFTEPILEERAEHHPEIKLALEARQLASFLSKYLIKYRDAVDSKGVLRYKLHQLRADEGGTITGRYSSSGDCNIQQVMKPDKQAEVLNKWILRSLFLCDKGSRGMLDADASQIEFRLFAHYADVPKPHSARLAEAYTKNPDIDFHQLITDDILHGCMPRVLAKNWNFRKLYGGGATKGAKMSGLDFAEAESQDKEYDRLFPEARRLLKYCEKIARRRGWIKTFMGRRRRFDEGDRYYSALNCVLQGGAAELMKLKLRHIYKERRTLGFKLRATVHDELFGDMQKKKTEMLMNEILREQEYKLKIPITWSVGTGRSWYESMK